MQKETAVISHKCYDFQENLNGTVQDDIECLRVNVLPVLPCVFFWLLLPLLCAQIHRIRVNGGTRSHPLPWNVLFITKTVSFLQCFHKITDESCFISITENE